MIQDLLTYAIPAAGILFGLLAVFLLIVNAYEANELEKFNKNVVIKKREK